MRGNYLYSIYSSSKLVKRSVSRNPRRENPYPSHPKICRFPTFCLLKPHTPRAQITLGSLSFLYSSKHITPLLTTCLNFPLRWDEHPVQQLYPIPTQNLLEGLTDEMGWIENVAVELLYHQSSIVVKFLIALPLIYPLRSPASGAWPPSPYRDLQDSRPRRHPRP